MPFGAAFEAEAEMSVSSDELAVFESGPPLSDENALILLFSVFSFDLSSLSAVLVSPRSCTFFWFGVTRWARAASDVAVMSASKSMPDARPEKFTVAIVQYRLQKNQ